jgi:hypothetical protein
MHGLLRSAIMFNISLLPPCPTTAASTDAEVAVSACVAPRALSSLNANDQHLLAAFEASEKCGGCGLGHNPISPSVDMMKDLFRKRSQGFFKTRITPTVRLCVVRPASGDSSSKTASVFDFHKRLA